MGGKGAQKVPQSILAPENVNLAVEELDDEEDVPIFTYLCTGCNAGRQTEVQRGDEGA